MNSVLRYPLFNFSYRKVGGLHFVKLGRFGCSFYVSKPVIEAKEVSCALTRPLPASHHYTTYSSAAVDHNDQASSHKFY